MNRFFDHLTPEQLTEQDPKFDLFAPFQKVSWGGRNTEQVADSPSGAYDAADQTDCGTREQDTTTALNDEDFGADEDDINSDEALASCGPEACDDEGTRTVKRSKIHLVKARAHIINGDRGEALKAVNTAYGHLDRYHRAMKAAGEQD